jgi:CheY-like chemotaxis protein
MARLLVVEDDVSIQHLVTTILEHDGYQVVIAQNGQIVLDKLHYDRDFDGVITGLQMPQMSGEQLIDILQVDFPFLPIVCMSVYDQRLARLRDKAVAYLIKKPFSRQQLLAAATSILANEMAYVS